MNIQEAVNALKKNKKVVSILQFGSSVTEKHFRDIDLCIFTSKSLSLKEKLKLQRNLPEKYDISFYDDLPLNLKREVLKGKVLFTNDYYSLLKEIPYVVREYPQYERFLEMYHQCRMEELA